MELDALSQRDAELNSRAEAQQAELDDLLARQEERLRAWQEGCAEEDARAAAREKEIEAGEQRCGVCVVCVLVVEVESFSSDSYVLVMCHLYAACSTHVLNPQTLRPSPSPPFLDAFQPACCRCCTALKGGRVG